ERRACRRPGRGRPRAEPARWSWRRGRSGRARAHGGRRRVKILFAGLGSIGQRHARNLRTLLGDDVELLAYRVRRTSPVIRPDLSAAADGDVEQALGIRGFDDLDSALAEEPDAVFVTNPNSLHVPVALAAARAGCHLFLEKPVASSLDGVDELAAEIERRG